MTPSDSLVVQNLSFSYMMKEVISNVSFSLPKGARCLLVGENGAGKSTLLKLLAGKNMVPREAIQVLGTAPFFDTSLNTRISYLGGNWVRDVAFAGYGVAYQGDFPVSQMIAGTSVPDEARLKKLIEVLGVDLGWRMHTVSEGQRRRVQLLLGLLYPYEVLYLDEITTDLDVVARQDLLQFLWEESEHRGVTIVYATHIFDGMQAWASHVVHMAYGKVLRFGSAESLISETEKILDAEEARERAEKGSAAIEEAGWIRKSWMNPLVRVVSHWIRSSK